MSDRSESPSDNKIDLKSVKGILNMKFFVPDYQRGYRWTKQQVKELLNDIYEFHRKEGKTPGEFYCLQPLVVKKMTPDDKVNRLIGKKGINDLTDEEKKLIEETWYEVIDGQQRLTTIFLLIKYLMPTIGWMRIKIPEDIYEIRYQKESSGNQNYLGSIDFDSEEKDYSSIDHLYITDASHTIKEWFNDKEREVEYSFCLALLKEDLDEKQQDKANNVRFVWYESEEKNSVEVFTRLNIGKISLTNAELIKALFLNSSNFPEKDDNLKLRQREIASEWDQIEYTLQNEEFWLFIHNKGYKNPTRIDFIFDIICERESGHYDIGEDNYKTFRYFYKVFKENKGSFLERWKEVKKIFQTFSEWFNDLELYHYVGYLVDGGEGIKGLYKYWTESKNKDDFVKKVKDRIWEKVMGKIEEKDSQEKPKEEIIAEKLKLISEKLDKTYETIADCQPLLLLHNIQTVIDQCKNSNERYGAQVFYKFPFHIYKNESWDVEHIDSNTPNNLNNPEDQRGWLFAIKDKVKKGSEVYKNASNVYNSLGKDNKDKKNNFEDLKIEIEKKFLKGEETFSDDEETTKEEKKNQIWNFALLDSSTNRGYGNSIFSAKRRCIIGKDKGKEIVLPDEWDGELKEKDAESSFIPPCTKYVFLKYYSPDSSDPNSWTVDDANAYKKDISKTLEKLFKLESRQDG